MGSRDDLHSQRQDRTFAAVHSDERASYAGVAPSQDGKAEGWVFPSDSKSGHLTTVAKAFEEARRAANMSKDIVLYSARHTFATKVMGATGDLSLVMRALGHTNAQKAMIYQHPSASKECGA